MKKVILLLLLLLPQTSLAFSPNSTHAGLTQEIVDFYNQSFETKISDIDSELIIQGSIDEDEPAVRVLNHFYDPTRNIGLKNAIASPIWASGSVPDNIYSWSKGIEAYAKGDTKTAFSILGHVLHLIEDAGVPEHTRDDPHPPGDDSPLEQWASVNKNRVSLASLGEQYFLTGVKPIELNSLADYFGFIANYSNNNFFSKDTITDSVYRNPEITEMDEKYAFGTDLITNNKVKLNIIVKSKDDSISKKLSTKEDSSVLKEYFDRLAKQIIPTGAGVVNLFIEEGEKAKEKYKKEIIKEEVIIPNNKVSLVNQYVLAYFDDIKSWKIVKSFALIKEKISETLPRVTLLNTANITQTVVKENAKMTVTYVQKNPSKSAVGPIFAFSDLKVNSNVNTTSEKESVPLLPQNHKVEVEKNIQTFPPTPPSFVSMPGFGGGSPPKIEPVVEVKQIESLEDEVDQSAPDPSNEDVEENVEQLPQEEATSTPVIEEEATSTPVTIEEATTTPPILEETATTTATSTPIEEPSEPTPRPQHTLTIIVDECGKDQDGICYLRHGGLIHISWQNTAEAMYYGFSLDGIAIRTTDTQITVKLELGHHVIYIFSFNTDDTMSSSVYTVTYTTGAIFGEV